VLTGMIYPLIVTLTSQAFFGSKANGSLVIRTGRNIGSALLAQSFTNTAWFWPRPSATDFLTVPSGASNKGPTSEELRRTVAQRAAGFRSAHGLTTWTQIPSDMLFASGSGLDPHISPEAARLQIHRVAQARGYPLQREKRLADLVEHRIERPQLGFLGEERVNILLLNLALEELE
jgi:potassium-transporting ATPase KdpC subunit